MKKLLRVSVVIVACFLLIGLTSCKTKEAYKGCINHLRNHMKDPSSLIIVSATGYEKDGEYAFKIRYNGKNSYGSYGGAEDLYFYIDNNDKMICSHCEPYDDCCLTYYTIFQLSGKEVYNK